MLGAGIGRDANKRDVLVGDCHHDDYFLRLKTPPMAYRTSPAHVGSRSGLWLWDGTDFVCPCHGSTFTTSGRVVIGPAPAPLRSFSTAFANNVLTVG